MQKFLCGLALLLFMLTAQPIYSQTLYMGENSMGVGVQYQYASISGQPYHTYLLGISKAKELDVTFALSRTSFEPTHQHNAYRSGTGTIQLTFFPSREENTNEILTTELLTGVGIAQIHRDKGLILMLGTGISRALSQNPSSPSMRPRISAAYTFARIEPESSNATAQVHTGISIAAELLIDVRFGDAATLIFTPSLDYYKNERTTGPGLSTSFVF